MSPLEVKRGPFATTYVDRATRLIVLIVWHHGGAA